MLNSIRTMGRLRVVVAAVAAALVAVGLAWAVSGQLPASQSEPAAPSIAQAEEVSVELDASYSDVKSGDWFKSYVDTVSSKGWMTGYSGTKKFGPNDSLSREQAATILYRYATGSTASDPYGIMTPFTDVYLNQWYTAAIDWCFDNGVITGYTNSDGSLSYVFGLGANITREQIATIVYRYALQCGASDNSSTSAVSKVSDYKSVSSWARSGVAWCYNNGIMTGYSGSGQLGPQNPVTRAEMAKIITVVSSVI